MQNTKQYMQGLESTMQANKIIINIYMMHWQTGTH